MCSQTSLAKAVGITQAAISLCLQRWGASIDDMNVEDAVRWYCERLRATAGKTGGMADGEVYDLSLERAKTEVLKQQKLRLDIAEQSGDLVRAEEFVRQYGAMMDSFRANALAIPAKIVQNYRTLKGVELDIDVIEDVVWEFLRTCSQYGEDSPKN